MRMNDDICCKQNRLRWPVLCEWVCVYQRVAAPLYAIAIWIPSFQPFAFNNWIIYYDKNVHGFFSLLRFASDFGEKNGQKMYARGKNDSNNTSE